MIKYLQNITDIIFNKENSSYISRFGPQVDNNIPEISDSCSEEYLKKAMSYKIEDYGFPQSCLGFSMVEFNNHNLKLSEQVKKYTTRIESFLGTYSNALIMAYPDNGYIGWHHNGNAPGYNILFTYSQDGDGSFNYYNYETKDVVKMPDPVGWSAKVGYYPSLRNKNEREKIFWHCAKTSKARITVAFVVPDKDIWINMIETITDKDFSKDTIDQYYMPI